VDLPSRISKAGIIASKDATTTGRGEDDVAEERNCERWDLKRSGALGKGDEPRPAPVRPGSSAPYGHSGDVPPSPWTPQDLVQDLERLYGHGVAWGGTSINPAAR
jgi:hypothetical protein